MGALRNVIDATRIFNKDKKPNKCVGKFEGKRFGNIVVLEYAGMYRFNKTNRSIWKCECDCGKVFYRTSRAITARELAHKSCGCRINQNGSNNCGWSGYKSIAGTFWRTVVNGAKTRNIYFDITIQDVWNLYEHQQGKCALSGVDIIFHESGKKLKKTTASVDRIDSSKGYTMDNIQLIHKHLNRMKNIYHNDYFIKICKLVAKHHGGAI